MIEQKPESQVQNFTDSTKNNPSENIRLDVVGRKTFSLSYGRGGIVGVKAGMTQTFNEDGSALAVTVIHLPLNIVTQLKTKGKEGYPAVQVGVLEKKPKAAFKSEQGHVKPAQATGFYHYQEFRFPDEAKLEGLTVGGMLSPDFIKEGDFVDLTAISKGKGFQGGMKRYHMGGGHKTHGASVSHRHLGSIGNRADPGKCFKNKKMAGHMGHEQVTIQNVRVVRVDSKNQLILIHGSIPGPQSGVVTIRRAIKSLV